MAVPFRHSQEAKVLVCEVAPPWAKGHKAPQSHELPFSERARLPGSKGSPESLGPISLRSFQSQFSAVFPRENSHLF